ncbi:MAG TPA: polyhydroxyalkanoate synthesis regulator DNA-binding domain-containing protein [Tepidisphaeraceae bacterium]|jgi:polyhydroxyalkanoate synthesis repressor PhaR|nr:polyhydroxyalkanoate synthesis regulator DNA-binding domain-containing protein [Tepidisphaeraceae bacterium]
MSEESGGARKRLTLRKYPNRRYYDTSRSRYVTLEEIYSLIREGYEVQASDSKTGQDITAKVLAQIILELDPPKLGVFPVPLLHRLIRANEQLVNDFVEKYFNQALSLFLDSQRTVEQSFRQAMGLQAGATGMPDWLKMMWDPLVPRFWPGVGNKPPTAGSSASASAPTSNDAAGDETRSAAAPHGAGSAAGHGSGNSPAELRHLVEVLRRQVSALEAQLPASKSSEAGAKKRAQTKKSAKRRPRS